MPLAVLVVEDDEDTRFLYMAELASMGYRTVGAADGASGVEVAIVAGSVQISEKGTVIRVNQIKHDRSKEHGAFATPNGRPRIKKSA